MVNSAWPCVLASFPYFSQPNQSPYKSFLNNPIYFIDPDGRKEYKISTRYVKGSGAAIVSLSQNDNLVMTDGKIYGNGSHVSYYKFYDYITYEDVYVNSDGSETVNSYHVILTDKFYGKGKDSRTIFSKPMFGAGYKKEDVKSMKLLSFDFLDATKVANIMVYGDASNYGDFKPEKRFGSYGEFLGAVNIGEVSEFFGLLSLATNIPNSATAKVSTPKAVGLIRYIGNIIKAKKEEKLRDQGKGSGYCEDCGKSFKSGNEITDPNDVQDFLKTNKDTIQANQHK